VPACTAYAYRAIERHEVVTAVPAACAGLSRAQVNQAASTAIRQAAGSGPKSAWRSQAASAEPWVTVLLTGPVPTTGGAPPAASEGGGPGGALLSPGSELAVKIAALLAWLITAASGGYVLVHWLRAGGRLRRRAVAAVPPVVVLGHAGLGLLGLVLWTVFAATGWGAVAWVTAGLLAPVAGLGMSVLVIGLPSPRPARGGAAPAPAEPVPAATAATAVLVAPPAPAAPAPARSGARQPVLVIALHGLFAATVLALVLTAAVGAG
jgi:manganese efflux pump family protein